MYIETNFAVGVAKGQDLDASEFLERPDPDISLVFPGVCYMESFSYLFYEMKKRGDLYKELKKHAEEVKRDQISPKAAVLAADLENSRLKGEELLSDLKTRLYETLGKISRVAVEVIGADQDTIQECLDYGYLDDPTDNLILCCVLRHARQNPQDPKAFLSGNSADFGQNDLKATFDSAGVKYFKEIRDAVGWLRSQPSAESTQGQ